MSLNCILVDDDIQTLELLSSYIGRTPGLYLLFAENSAQKAFDLVRANTIVPDVAFLDVEMPQMTGFDLLKVLPPTTKVIFITGYNHYAVDAFEVEALDFLTKPITYSRFLKAIERAQKHFALVQQKEDSKEFPDLVVVSKKKRHEIELKNILYIESTGKLITIYLEKVNYPVYQPLKELEKVLPERIFLRVHQGYIIHLYSIVSKTNSSLTLKNGKVIPIGKQYKDEVFRRLGE